MYITDEIYKEIFENIPDSPPEMGGIFGGSENIIKVVEFDKGLETQYKKLCCYIPDVEHLNTCIDVWAEKGIDFYGVFHTHFGNSKKLSEGDEIYIKKIVRAMPFGKDKLYFPIVVLPKKVIIAYLAVRKKDEIYILEENIRCV